MQNYSTQNLFRQRITGFATPLLLAVTLAVLAGCGAGQAIPSLPAPVAPSTTGPSAATIQLLVSSPQMPSSGTNTIDLTAVVLSSTKQTITGKTVIFTAGDATETAFINNVSASGVSDANGLVTAKLNLGADKRNRTIAITATTDSAIGNNSVDVTGTAITVSGNSSLAFNASTALTIRVKDSAGTALSNQTLTVTSANGNTIALTPATGISDASGQITATVKADSAAAAAAGKDTITVTLANTNTTPIPTSATQDLTISSASFSFNTPAASTDIPLNTATNVSINWKNAGAAVVGSTVNFSTSRGTITTTATTNALGDTPVLPAAGGVTVSSATAGTAILSASGSGGTPAATLNVAFVATSANTIAAQAVPGTIAVTSGSKSQTNNVSTISVLVRDAANNLVKNAGVDFTITTDPSGGALNSARAVTDVNGTASVTYTAGTNSSPSNGVTIRAAVSDITITGFAPVLYPAPPAAGSVSGTTTLTVAAQPLLVRLGTDNLVGSTAPVNTKVYAAVVTDSAGNAVVGNSVRFALRPGRWQKGFYTFVSAVSRWVQTVTVTCPNEDLNFNGILDVPPAVGVVVSEDINGNGALEPGNVATVTGAGVTDASGIALATLTYPKDHASWAEQILEARTGVVGNDPPAVVSFFLPGVATDYTDSAKVPPGVTSPYGAGNGANAVCTNLN